MAESNENQALVRLNNAEIQRIAQSFPDVCKPVFDDVERSRGELLRQLSAQVPNAINVVHAAGSGDVYRLAKDVVLKQGEDGLYSAVVRDEKGRILEHVKLEKSTSDFARAASFSYSILNAAVGQANMMAIAEHLAEIGTQLDEAKKRDYIQQISPVESASMALKETLCLRDEDHQRQSIVLYRDRLRTALACLKGFIQIEIDAMPEYHEKSFWEKLFSNWGSAESTLPEKARRRFEYIAWALPVWCRGMSQLVLTDAYVSEGEFPAAADFTKDLKQMIVASKLTERVKYVPLMGGKDPIELVKAFQTGIAETETVFAQMKDRLKGRNLEIELEAN